MAVENHRRAFDSKTQALTILYLLAAINAIWGNLIEQPENTAVMLNSSTTLKCRSSENWKFLWYSFRNNLHKEELWNGYYLNPAACSCPCCVIDNSEPGKYNLNITAKRETAKQYMCIEPGTLMEASACLIVIESALNCTCNQTDKDATLSCAIGFYGEWEPQIKWNASDGGQVEEATVFEKDGQVSSILTMPLTTSAVYYTASVYFSVSDRPAGVTASNVPVYEDKWTSPSFKLNESSSNAIAIALPCCLVAVAALGAGFYFVPKKLKSRKKQRMEVFQERSRLA